MEIIFYTKYKTIKGVVNNALKLPYKMIVNILLKGYYNIKAKLKIPPHLYP